VTVRKHTLSHSHIHTERLLCLLLAGHVFPEANRESGQATNATPPLAPLAKTNKLKKDHKYISNGGGGK